MAKEPELRACFKICEHCQHYVAVKIDFGDCHKNPPTVYAESYIYPPKGDYDTCDEFTLKEDLKKSWGIGA